MLVSRSEIEKALDNLISDEEGMKFQGLAVVLAKQRWPDLIACERKKDRGADAIGEGKILACCLRADLEKLKSDATKIRQNFDATVKALVFATAEGVTNATAKTWAEEIQKEFRLDLIVVPRADLIASLSDPENAGLLRTNLGIPVSLEPSFEELRQATRAAASEILANWLAPLSGRPLIQLRAATLRTDGASESVTFRDLYVAMQQSRRLILEAPAGRGKTTTLLQLACATDASGIPFLIDLPAWIRSQNGILPYLAGMPAFQARGIDAGSLARLANVEHFSFFLNGWNEVEQSHSAQASVALQELERDFPAAGILVATRTHHVSPPLPGAMRAQLLPLDRSERADYLNKRLGSRADELRAKLESDTVLDELTRTPLILVEVALIFEAGRPIPKTKLGILESVITLMSQTEPHTTQLQLAPLNGCAQPYLETIAGEMTRRGTVALSEEEARISVRSTSFELRDLGQIGTIPEPHAVLTALCADHVLERVTYPVVSFRFSHQQFQEFYAARVISERLDALLRDETPARRDQFLLQYVNQPAWTEPLRMMAGQIGAAATVDPSALEAGRVLVELAERADPVFAASLAYELGPNVWRAAGASLAKTLRGLYRSQDAHARKLAVAGMLASGSEEFGDILLPLLTSDNDQVRLSTYRTWPDFHVPTLGRSWENTVRHWSDAARADFVSEVLTSGNVRETVAPFALSDPSIEVRLRAISSFVWSGSKEEIAKIAASLDNETFQQALQEMPLEAIPDSIKPRALSAYRQLYQKGGEPWQRLRLLLTINELAGSVTPEELKEGLDACLGKPIDVADRYVVKPALELVRRTDPLWVSHCIAARIAEDKLRPEGWITFVSSAPPDLTKRWIERFETEDLQFARYGGAMTILAATADGALVERAFARLRSVWDVIVADLDSRHDLEWAIERQLEALLRAFPPDVVVEGLAPRISGPVDRQDLTLLTHLFGRLAEGDSDVSDSLSEKPRNLLRDYFRRGLQVLLREDDFSGEQKANMAAALARIGDPEDLAILRQLIQADITRMREGMQARASGDRGRKANGAVMRYANWHVRSVLRFSSEKAEAVLLEVLGEPEYEQMVAWGLMALAGKGDPIKEYGAGMGFVGRTDGREIWKAREGEPRWNFEETRRTRYATAIRAQIDGIVKESEDATDKRARNFRVKELLKPLATIDGPGSAEFILAEVCNQDQSNGWVTVQILDTLLSHGVVLPTDKTLQIFDSLLARARTRLWDKQEVGLLTRALCLLPFIEDPAAGISRMRAVVAELKLRDYELGEVAMAAAYSRCPEAIALLTDFMANPILMKQIGQPWINALAALDSPEARRLLLSLVDPEISGIPDTVTFERQDVVAARLAATAARDHDVARRLLSISAMPLTGPRRDLLTKTLGMMQSTEATLASLNLIDDSSAPAVPYELWKQIEAAFVEHRSIGAGSNGYTLWPRPSNPIRNRLAEMAANDDRRKNAASSLLNQIEVWRLEYGRPFNEPRNPVADATQKTDAIEAF